MDYLAYLGSIEIKSEVKLLAKSLYEDIRESTTDIILPKIINIEITGLYPYKSDHIIKLKNEKANIIYGGNGAGKTTCINSIEFGLLGSSSEIEMKTNFSNRVINKYKITSIMQIENKKYKLERSLSPFSESHDVTFQRLADNELEQFYEITEGVQDVNTIFHGLTGLLFSDYAKIFDFFSLRVPRRHYLASIIFNTNGSMYRQRIFSKLFGQNIIVKLSEDAFKRWNSAKTAISQINRKISMFESLNQIDIVNVLKSPSSTGENETIEQELQLNTNKLKNLQDQKESYYQKLNDLRKKEFELHSNNQTSEMFEKKTKLDKLEQLKNNEWFCELCESDYSEEAKKRIKEGYCPNCGSISDMYLSSQKEYNRLREEIHELFINQKRIEDRNAKYVLLQDKLIKEISALDREITLLHEKILQNTRENSVVSVGRTHDVLFQLQQDLHKFQQEENTYSVLYTITRTYLETETNQFILELNERFSYYQRELFDSSKWSLTTSFDIVAEDGQEFRHLSHGEKNITDILFRMAVFDVLINLRPDQNLFFIIDTPEEGLDAAFYKRFQNVFIDFVNENKNILIALTSCERDFVDNLDPKLFRIENLLIKSSNSRPFQVKQLSLLQFVNIN
jgi:DNA repair exonuclease SbcCD ATPase subunit